VEALGSVREPHGELRRLGADPRREPVRIERDEVRLDPEDAPGELPVSGELALRRRDEVARLLDGRRTGGLRRAARRVRRLRRRVRRAACEREPYGRRRARDQLARAHPPTVAPRAGAVPPGPSPTAPGSPAAARPARARAGACRRTPSRTGPGSDSPRCLDTA